MSDISGRIVAFDWKVNETEEKLNQPQLSNGTLDTLDRCGEGVKSLVAIVGEFTEEVSAAIKHNSPILPLEPVHPLLPHQMHEIPLFLVDMFAIREQCDHHQLQNDWQLTGPVRVEGVHEAGIFYLCLE